MTPSGTNRWVSSANGTRNNCLIHISTVELKATAVELQDLVQQKVGTTKFAITYNQIRQTVLGVQRERRTDRAAKVCFELRSAGTAIDRGPAVCY